MQDNLSPRNVVDGPDGFLKDSVGPYLATEGFVQKLSPPVEDGVVWNCSNGNVFLLNTGNTRGVA